jgi:putative DNA primase/helicase
MPDGVRLDAIRDNAPDEVAAFTEEAIGRSFAAEQEGALAFDHSLRVWFVWDGARWAADKTDLAFARAREFVHRTSRSSLLNERERAAMGRISFHRAVDSFARADQRLAVHQGVWDADPWLLGVPSGVVDLRTGKLRRAQPTDWISRQCAVLPSSRTASMWLTFLDDATRGDKEMQAGTVAVRARGGVDLGVMSLDAFAARLSDDVAQRRGVGGTA